MCHGTNVESLITWDTTSYMYGMEVYVGTLGIMGMLDTLGVLTVAVCVDLPPCDPTSGLSSGLLVIVLKPYLLVE